MCNHRGGLRGSTNPTYYYCCMSGYPRRRAHDDHVTCLPFDQWYSVGGVSLRIPFDRVSKLTGCIPRQHPPPCHILLYSSFTVLQLHVKRESRKPQTGGPGRGKGGRGLQKQNPNIHEKTHERVYYNTASRTTCCRRPGPQWTRGHRTARALNSEKVF